MWIRLVTIANYIPTIFAAGQDCGQNTNFLGIFPPWYKYLEFTEGCRVNINFSSNPQDIFKIGLAFIDILLRLGGLVALGYIIYGGFKFITSQGEPEGIKDAKTTIMNALIGVVIVTLASGIVVYIAGRF
ncbi:hypothetical protein KC946_03960 [Candidatus Saccharibacteria bacterium]|nr:hypothetical protein [Candidatus Saccharibacteria bacterium]